MDVAAGDLRVIDPGGGGHLASEDHLPGGDEGFAGHAGLGVLGQDGIQDGVADLISHLVGMTHGDRFAGEQVSAAAKLWRHARISSRAGNSKGSK